MSQTPGKGALCQPPPQGQASCSRECPGVPRGPPPQLACVGSWGARARKDLWFQSGNLKGAGIHPTWQKAGTQSLWDPRGSWCKPRGQARPHPPRRVSARLTHAQVSHKHGLSEGGNVIAASPPDLEEMNMPPTTPSSGTQQQHLCPRGQQGIRPGTRESAVEGPGTLTRWPWTSPGR